MLQAPPSSVPERWLVHYLDLVIGEATRRFHDEAERPGTPRRDSTVGVGRRRDVLGDQDAVRVEDLQVEVDAGLEGADSDRM